MIRGIALLLLLCGAGPDDDAAKEKIKEFRAEMRKARTEDDFVACVENLGGMQHKKILAELAGWLRKSTGPVRREAARQIAKYEKDVKAAGLLLKAAAKEKDEDTVVKFLECVGEIKARPSGKTLTAFFRNRITNIAATACEAAGEVKSRDTISPLITLLKQLEAIKDDPNEPGGPPMPGPGAGDENEQVQRKRQLMPVVLRALKDITDEKYAKAKGWERWWAKNRKTFKELDP